MALASSLTLGNYFILEHRLSPQETKNLNNKLSELGIAHSLERKSIIDNCYDYHKKYQPMASYQNKTYTSNEILLMILIATDNKIFSVINHVFDIKNKEIEDFLAKTTPLIERSYTTIYERHQHSGYKLILNSTSWIFHILSSFCINPENLNGIIEQVSRIVKNTSNKKEYAYLYKKVIGFDNLNQLFQTHNHDKDYGASLIFDIYEKLSESLSCDTHYWLQRAKSILYLKREEISHLKKGADYAKKAYFDSDNAKLKINATTTLALLYGRIASEERYSSTITVSEAIRWYSMSLEENDVNQKYVNDILTNAKSGSDLDQLCKQYVNLSLNNEDKKKLSQIITKRNEFQRVL